MLVNGIASMVLMLRTVCSLSVGRPLGRIGPALDEEALSRVSRCMDFLDVSAEPFTCVSSVVRRLVKGGFQELDEKQGWSGRLQRGGKYFFTRNKSSIVAFAVGGKYSAGQRFKIVGAHTDSPNLRVKPNSKKNPSNGLTQVSVETYGGGLWHTWFDRDLSIAGRVLLRQNNTEGKSNFVHKLVKVDRPILHIPNLCIHLRTPEEREAFKVNKEEHLVPILCEEIKNSLTNKESSSDKNSENSDPMATWTSNQSQELMETLSSELNCDIRDIVDFELSLYDTQKAAQGGARKEFLTSSRLDNLASCFIAVEALLDFAQKDLDSDSDVSMIALFDHEEVGSDSYQGAGSTLMRDAVVRVNDAFQPGTTSQSESFRSAIAKSLVLSVDMAHAIHPNYASKHEANHAPKLNGGIVIKSNSNQRYATNGLTSFFVRELARREEIPVQNFVVRNDCPCGSTIGPMYVSLHLIRLKR